MSSAKPDAASEILLSRDQIRTIVANLAEKINRYYADLPKNESILVIGVLKGAFIFLADLVREFDFPVQIDFIRIASYGDATKSTGTVKLLMEPAVSLNQRRVLIVEDIIDTGYSMAFLRNYCVSHQAADVATAVLLDKPARRVTEVPCEFVGVQVEDKFLGGYGLDGGFSFQRFPWIFSVNGTDSGEHSV
ncbi:MAG: hypoxanthine phosphoribosyltransferase [Planctomycetia bacterium]|nr:hypoxanthine phosphoribosyltransferase [Planctomycetia bacterium]